MEYSLADLDNSAKIKPMRQLPRYIRQFIAPSASAVAPLCAIFAPGDNG
jgi:hypothetical protein